MTLLAYRPGRPRPRPARRARERRRAPLGASAAALLDLAALQEQRLHAARIDARATVERALTLLVSVTVFTPVTERSSRPLDPAESLPEPVAARHATPPAPGPSGARPDRTTIVVAAFTPIDTVRTSALMRYHVPIPAIGRLLAWLGAVLEARFILRNDERVPASSRPPHIDLRSNKLVRADAGIGVWHRLYHRA